MRNVDRSRWRRLLATLAPASPDIAERLAGHYATEIRLAHGLAQRALQVGVRARAHDRQPAA